jgi:hypothetical protein
VSDALCGKTGYGAKGLSSADLDHWRRWEWMGSIPHPPCWQCVLPGRHDGPHEDFRGCLFDSPDEDPK